MTNPDALRIGRELSLDLLSHMVRIRRFEDKCAELYTQEKIRGFLHLYDGEEAVAVGIIPNLEAQDAVVATYREHGHALVRGVPMTSILAEMLGKQTGCSRGRGGSMHLFDSATRFYGGNAIVGGGLPMAVGLALAAKMAGRDEVVVCFFGEGAVAEGEFHESLNLAQLWQLPVLFVCENNGYAMGTALARSESEIDLVKKAESYEVHAQSVDGMDVIAVTLAARAAVAQVRAGQGPVFLECKTYRFRAHSMFDAQKYRDKAEVEQWRQRGPIVRFQNWLMESHVIHQSDIDEIEARVAAEIDTAQAAAEAAPFEPVEQLYEHVYASCAAMSELTYREAVREAMCTAMRADERVFLMGEDVGRYGGCYGVSMGMLEEFGEERVRDTPLAESGFTGAGIGAAMGGMRPIVELMTVNFSLLALDQIMNTAATVRHMSGGQFGVPIVIRMATGAGKQLAAQHSHSLEGWYAHIPGLKVVAPATIEDARGMLQAALDDPDPVLIFENVMLYNSKGEVGDPSAIRLQGAAVRRPGADLSLLTYGGSLPKALAAAEQLSGQGVDVEVVDLRCLRPLDDATIMASVSKTRRALIVDEGWRSGSLAAEISARIMEQAFWSLDGPVERVCSAEVPIPYAKHMEAASIPQVETIVAKARAMCMSA